GESDTAFVLGRPPGHHATKSRSMGFCLLNTVAIAATHALASGLARVAIIDWDVHHGNGTQDIFAARSDVLYCSIHQYGNIFPGTGAASERGQGPGAGYTLNVPLAPGSSGHAIVSALETTIVPAVRNFRPDLILVSAGYDAHEADPLGGLRATEQDFRRIARLMRTLADETTGGRLIAILEGGYNPAVLARCVADTIEIFDTPLL
ncbi:MAG TPA: histone deacetylase, partial [Thermomicrobiales bacterium]|nr:histone deacetylase [Thermomicrobiales bacterium]